MAKAVNSKICLKCGRVLPLNDFYMNRKWKDQNYHDGYCRQCYQRYCKDEDSVEDYFNANNRKWNHELWQVAAKKAEYSLSNSETYLKASHDERVRLLDQATVRVLPSLMNLTRYYFYVDNQHTKDVYEIERQKNAEERKNAKVSYSPIWRGNFTEEQIQSMDAMYEEYEKDYDMSTVSRRDYVRKLIKASMNVDIAQDKLRHGEITVSEYRDLTKIYDDLAKSSAIAEASRKAGGSTALSSLGNIILGLEINHHLDINPYTFPEDDVDKVYNDYAHLAAAVGAQL